MGDKIGTMYDYQVEKGITTLSYDRWLEFTKEEYGILKELLNNSKLIKPDEIVIELLCSKDLSIVEGIKRHLLYFKEYEVPVSTNLGEEYEDIPLSELVTANFSKSNVSNTHIVVSSTLLFEEAIRLLDENRISRLTFALIEDDTYSGFSSKDLSGFIKYEAFPSVFEAQSFTTSRDNKTYGIYSYTKRR